MPSTNLKESCLNIEEESRTMQVDTLLVGPMQAACYVVSDKATDELMVIDPGGDPELVIESVSCRSRHSVSSTDWQEGSARKATQCSRKPTLRRHLPWHLIQHLATTTMAYC